MLRFRGPTAPPLQPRWSSSAFLLYTGALVMLVSAVWLLVELSEQSGTGALVGWSTLVLAVFLALALLLQRAGQPLAAGLFALLALVAFGVWVGALEDLVELFPDEEEAADSFFQPTFEPGLILLELLVIAAGLAALARFRFPLLVLPIAVLAWYALVDLDSLFFGADAGNDTRAGLAIVVGLLIVVAATVVDRAGARPYGFWLHVVGGLSLGGGILWFLHGDTWEWIVILAAALGYIVLALLLSRSSYTVLAAATHFVEEWFSLSQLIPFFEAESSQVDQWARPLAYAGVGAALILLGLAVERRRRPVLGRRV